MDMEEPDSSDAFVAGLRACLAFLQDHGFERAAAAVYEQLEGIPGEQSEGPQAADGDAAGSEDAGDTPAAAPPDGGGDDEAPAEQQAPLQEDEGDVVVEPEPLSRWGAPAPARRGARPGGNSTPRRRAARRPLNCAAPPRRAARPQPRRLRGL